MRTDVNKGYFHVFHFRLVLFQLFLQAENKTHKATDLVHQMDRKKLTKGKLKLMMYTTSLYFLIYPWYGLHIHRLHPSINQIINKSINYSINQSINDSINQSINYSINQSINQSIRAWMTTTLLKLISSHSSSTE